MVLTGTGYGMNRFTEHLRIVLVGTQHPGNIGSAARAMKTMGWRNLHLVSPERFPDREAFALSAGAADLIDAAQIHDNLDAALVGCRLVLGATARRRSVPMPEYSPREAAERMIEAAQNYPVALVFGRERTGLENEELQRCHGAVCIPANPDYSSLNLAAAVQILCYELRLAGLACGQGVEPTPVGEAPPAPASADQLERYFTHLAQTLDAIDFHKGRAPELVMQRLRRLYLRAEPDERELRILHGILADSQRMARLARDGERWRSDSVPK